MNALGVVVLLGLGLADATSPSTSTGSTCSTLKTAYKANACCGNPTKVTSYTLAGANTQVVPKTPKSTSNFLSASLNTCAGKKPYDNVAAHAFSTPGYAGQTNGLSVNGTDYFKNINCTINGVLATVEQAGANVTMGYRGQIDAVAGGRWPINTTYLAAGLCPVNVHWHLGTEHYSAGEYDEYGSGPVEGNLTDLDGPDSAGGAERKGYQCRHYDANDSKFTTPYMWKFCSKMTVGETYEVHWPHSRDGACGTPDQWQTPFYDGVFCRTGTTAGNIDASAAGLNTWQNIGVQAQIFTIVNDERYYYPNLMQGMIVEGDFGTQMTKYTGSTTGTSRDNTVCSRFTPITWQVDRKCHLISASSFDKMCADMKQVRDDMSGDTHSHGSRMLVSDQMAANNQMQRRAFDPKDGQSPHYSVEGMQY